MATLVTSRGAAPPAADAPPAESTLRVLHVITGLGTGGAEAMLYQLISATSALFVSNAVVSLTNEGVHGGRLRAAGIPVTCLGVKRGVPDPRALVGLVRLLRRERPHLVQSWMYHANLVAGAAAWLARVPVVWGIHHADVDPRHMKRLAHATNVLCARLSGLLPARVVCCAHAALRSHRDLGYRAARLVVIPNGFEVERFDCDPDARLAVRRELSISPDAPVVGLVARYHPDKDHETFLAAASAVARTRPDAVFAMAGTNVDDSNRALTSRVDALGLRASVRLLGVRRDMPALLSACDALASSSRSEAFPLVLGEAMSCRVPCVATDVGDSRQIVGETGVIVPPRDPRALAAGILKLLALDTADRRALGAAARARVLEHHDLRAVAKAYVTLYRDVVAESAGAGARSGGA